MFETPVRVEAADAVSCAAVLDGWVSKSRRLGAERLAAVVAWADLHPPVPAGRNAVDRDGWSPRRRRLQARDVEVGAEGTPAVSEFAVEELGCLLQITTASAAMLLRDGLELRHRHPLLWEAVMTGRVEDYKARAVAKATRAAGLDLAQAMRVDAEVVEAVCALPWGRALAVVDAAVIAADPAGHQARCAEAAARRYVATSRTDAGNGMRTLIARTTAADVIRVEAMVARLAQLLAHAGDTDPVQVRRAKAFAVLADPARACLLLARGAQPSEAQPSGAQPSGAQPSDEEPERFEEDPVTGEPVPGAEPESGGPTAAHVATEVGRLLESLGERAWDRLRPRTVLYLHLAEEALRTPAGTPGAAAVARAEGLGPVATSQLEEWLGADHVTVQPVIDPGGQTPADGYEIPTQLREAVRLLHPHEVFPYGTLRSRAADLDHTQPYRPRADGGPPGQTRLDNLGPLGRRHHNAKTFGRFTCHQPLPGLYLWRTPTGYWYQVDHAGTHRLGRRTPAILSQQRQPQLGPMESHFARLVLTA